MKLIDRFFHWWAAATTPNAAYQLCHGLIGYGWMLTCGPKHKWIAVGAMVAFSSWKEFWFDNHFETEAVSGGEKGDVLDFLSYQAGVALGLLRMAI